MTFLSSSFEEFIEQTWYHAVIQFLDLVRFSSVEFLKIRVRGKDVYLPVFKSGEMSAHLTVEIIDPPLNAYPFPVRRIRYDCASPTHRGYRKRVFCKDFDVISDPCVLYAQSGSLSR